MPAGAKGGADLGHAVVSRNDATRQGADRREDDALAARSGERRDRAMCQCWHLVHPHEPRCGQDVLGERVERVALGRSTQDHATVTDSDVDQRRAGERSRDGVGDDRACPRDPAACDSTHEGPPLHTTSPRWAGREDDEKEGGSHFIGGDASLEGFQCGSLEYFQSRCRAVDVRCPLSACVRVPHYI